MVIDRMMKSVFFMWLLMALGAAPAQALTVRHSFDVVDIELYLFNIEDSAFNEVTRQDADYGALVSALHPWRDLLGQTGHVVLEARAGLYPTQWAFTCVSGFLCNGGYGMGGVGGSPFTLEWDVGSFTGWRTLYGSSTTLYFDDDLNSGGRGFAEGDYYRWLGADARLTLANVTQTVLAPVPLPASGWLFLLIAPAFVWLKRRAAAMA